MAGIAVVGASQSGIPWTEWLLRNLERYDYDAPVWLVNPKREEMLGHRCYPSVESLPEDPDIGALVVGARLVAPMAKALLERGCSRFLIVSNGFGETGTEAGRGYERDLREVFADSDALVVGPNCVGFASFNESVCAITQPVFPGIEPGPVTVISQSGGLTSAAMGAVVGEGLGIDMAYSIGNGVVVGLAKAVATALERETTRVVVGVVESIDDPDGLAAAARRARELGKLIVFLPLGQSEGGRGIAASHTGAVVGEQRLISAWLGEQGIVLADSAEQLGRIASLFLAVGRVDPDRGAFIATVSGGGAGLSSDIADRHGVRLAQVAPRTEERLRELLPDGAFIGNPLDVQTGDPQEVYTAIADDPAVELMIEPWMLPWPDDDLHWQRDGLERIAGIAGAAGRKVLVGTLFHQDLNEWAEGFAARPDTYVTPNLELTMAALGKLYAAAGGAPPVPPAATGDGATAGLVAEVEAREVLAACGLPVVKGASAGDVEELVGLAAGLRRPWVAKLAADSVGHKGRVGGVKLGIVDEAALRAACDEIAAAAVASGALSAEQVGFLLNETEMGPEILIGALRDPVAGPTITVGVGGWAAESGAVFGTVLLPAGRDRLDELIRRWRLDHLLGPERAAGLAEFLATLGAEFADGRLSGYDTVEINPLILTDHGPSVVDALLVRRS